LSPKMPTLASLICMLIIVAGCSPDPNEKANELYVEASQIGSQMRKSSNKYSEAFELYKKSLANLELILATYPSSNVAVGLASGEVKISGLPLSEYREIQPWLLLGAKAEQDVVAFIKTIMQGVDEKWKNGLFRRMVLNYLEKNYVKDALTVAELISNERSREQNLFEIANKYVENGEISKSLMLVDMIKDVVGKSNLYAAISLEYLDQDQPDKAIEMIKKAITTADGDYRTQNKIVAIFVSSLDDENEYKTIVTLHSRQLSQPDFMRNDYISLLIKSYLENGKPDKALTAINYINDFPRFRLHSLLKVVSNFNENSDYKSAIDLLDKLKSEVYLLEDGSEQALFISDLAVQYSKAGNRHLSSRLLQQAYDKISYSNKVVSRGKFLGDIAERFAESGQVDRAEEIVIQAANMAKSYEVEILTKYANKCIELGHFMGAVEVAKQIDVDSEKSAILSVVSGHYAETKQFEKSIQLIDSINDDFWKNVSLINLSKGYVDAGVAENSILLFMEALKIANITSEEAARASARFYMSINSPWSKNK